MREFGFAVGHGAAVASGGTPTGGTEASDGGSAAGAGGEPPFGEAGAANDSGGAGGAGGDASLGPPFDECTVEQGGRGNICGGVIADARFLEGSGFDEYEGARVVTDFGYTLIRDGAFWLYVGTYPGCDERSATYRIDTARNGICDSDDVAYEVTGDGVTLQVEQSAPGTQLACISPSSMPKVRPFRRKPRSSSILYRSRAGGSPTRSPRENRTRSGTTGSARERAAGATSRSSGRGRSSPSRA